MDIYGIFQDSKNSSDYLLPYSNGNIHPKNTFYVEIAAKTFEVLFPIYYRNGGVNNRGQRGITNAAAPSTYPLAVSLDFVLVSDGFPVNGLMMTTRGGLNDAQVVQRLNNYGGSESIEYFRTGFVGDGNTFNAWEKVQKVITPTYVDKGDSGKLLTTAASLYPYGVSVDFVFNGNGWPISGMLITTKGGYGNGVSIIQRLTNYQNPTVEYIRVGSYDNFGTSGWQDFKPVQLIAPVQTFFDNGMSGVTSTKNPVLWKNGYSADFVLASDGFPINGFLTTVKCSDQLVRQELTSYDTATNMYVRVGYTGGGGNWQAWKQVTLV